MQHELSTHTPGDEPYDTTIDWSAFVVAHDDQRGISLRALVDDAGLFTRFDNARRALQDSGIGFSSVLRKTPGPKGGRPQEDCLLALDDAIAFCATARTDVGRRVMRLIIQHHQEFQRLLEGDVRSHAKLHDATARRRPEFPPSPPRSGAAIRAELEDRRARAAALRELVDGVPMTEAQRIDLVVRSAEILSGENLVSYKPQLRDTRQWKTATQVGHELGVSANKVGRVATALELRDAESMSERVSITAANGRACVQWLYSPDAVAAMREHLAECEDGGAS